MLRTNTHEPLLRITGDVSQEKLKDIQELILDTWFCIFCIPIPTVPGFADFAFVRF